jgi:hypothetical protein
MGGIRYLARIAIIYRPEHCTRTVGPWVQLEAQRPPLRCTEQAQ